MRKVLITGAGGAGIFPIWNILNKKYKFFFADNDINSIHPKIPNKFKIKVPLGNSKKFTSELKKIIKKKNIDLIIPTVDEEIINIYKDNILRSISYLPDMQFTKRTMDKFILINELKRLKFNAPNTYLSCSKNIPFPKKYIIKPRFGRGSQNIHLIKKKNQIFNYLGLYNYSCKDVIVQKFISGDEYTIFVGMDENKKVKKIYPFKINKKKGITISGNSHNEKKVINFVRKFSEKFKTKNSFNMQLILSGGKIYPIEVNPRISTTFFLTLLDGFDPFFLKSKKNLSQITYAKKKIFLDRYWDNIITK